MCGAARPPVGSDGGLAGYEGGGFNGVQGYGTGVPGRAPRGGYFGEGGGAGWAMNVDQSVGGGGHFRGDRQRHFPPSGVPPRGGRGGGDNLKPHALWDGGSGGSSGMNIGVNASLGGGSSTSGAVSGCGEDCQPEATRYNRQEGDNGVADASGDDKDAVVVETLQCPHHLAGAVIGRHGAAIALLRRETGCHIEIEASPGMGAPRNVTVCGPRDSVKEALARIHETLSQKSAGGGFTHDQGGSHSLGGHMASEEDRQKTSRLIDSLEAAGILRRAWLDERCMQVLMMLPYETTGRVLHEAERVDLWKTRNVSAFLMMLVKSVQQYPDKKHIPLKPRRDNEEFRGGNRQGSEVFNQHGSAHGPRQDMGAQWGRSQADYVNNGPVSGFMAVPWVPATPCTAPQAYPGYGVPQLYEVAYSPGSTGLMPQSSDNGPSVASWGGQNGGGYPQQPPHAYQGYAVPSCAVYPSRDAELVGPPPATRIAGPVGEMQNLEYGYTPIGLPGSPQHGQQEVFSASSAPLPEAVLRPPMRHYRGGTQTPEGDSSVAGDTPPVPHLPMCFPAEAMLGVPTEL